MSLIDLFCTGAPDPPSNCTVTEATSDVVILCAPAFNGGSLQHFILEKMRDVEFETIETEPSSPKFNFLTYENVTVRVCAVNQDFPGLKRCSIPLDVNVGNTGTLRCYDVYNRDVK